MKEENQSKLYGFFSRDAMPEGTEPLANFKLGKYLGKWYDIAHMNFRHEGVESTNVYVIYSNREDGLAGVNNNAFVQDKQEWYSRVGKAKFRGSVDVGALDVTFNDLKWAGYNVVALDENYTYALVFGRSLDFMWMLSRTKSMPENIKQKYLDLATSIGYDISKLSWTIHDRDDV